MLIFCIHQLCINIWIFATMKYKNRWIQLCMFLFNLFQIDSENVMHLLALPSTGSRHKMYYMCIDSYVKNILSSIWEQRAWAFIKFLP